MTDENTLMETILENAEAENTEVVVESEAVDEQPSTAELIKKERKDKVKSILCIAGLLFNLTVMVLVGILAVSMNWEPWTVFVATAIGMFLDIRLVCEIP